MMTREEVAKELMKHYYSPVATDWTAMDSMLRLADWHLEQLRNHLHDAAKIAYDAIEPYSKHLAQDTHCAILALNEPPKPVWCEHLVLKGDYWLFNDQEWHPFAALWKFCPICGKERPKP